MNNEPKKIISVNAVECLQLAIDSTSNPQSLVQTFIDWTTRVFCIKLQRILFCSDTDKVCAYLNLNNLSE